MVAPQNPQETNVKPSGIKQDSLSKKVGKQPPHNGADVTKYNFHAENGNIGSCQLDNSFIESGGYLM